jgi:hypothetical protein
MQAEQLLLVKLPIASNGPIMAPKNAGDGLKWAQCRSLLITLNGPNIAREMCCR